MISFLINYVTKIEGVTIETDEKRNLFITKNTTNPNVYPCLVAHMDEVPRYTAEREIIYKKGKAFGRYVKTKAQCGLGADDKNGIYISLHLLSALPDVKICFTTEEEIGALGAREAALNLNFFQDCRFLIEPDRRGSSDLITQTNGMKVTSQEFLDDIADLMTEFKFKTATGTFTDIGELKDTVDLSAVNVSCGYYSAHSHSEYTILSELENTLNFIYRIITLNDKVYEHKATSAYNYYRGRKGSNHYDWDWDSYDYGYGSASNHGSRKNNKSHTTNYSGGQTTRAGTVVYDSRKDFNTHSSKNGYDKDKYGYSRNDNLDNNSVLDEAVNKCAACRDFDCMRCTHYEDMYSSY